MEVKCCAQQEVPTRHQNTNYTITHTHRQGLQILINDISMEMECKINLQSILTLLLPPFLKQTIENVKYISLSN